MCSLKKLLSICIFLVINLVSPQLLASASFPQPPGGPHIGPDLAIIPQTPPKAPIKEPKHDPIPQEAMTSPPNRTLSTVNASGLMASSPDVSEANIQIVEYFFKRPGKPTVKMTHLRRINVSHPQVRQVLDAAINLDGIREVRQVTQIKGKIILD